MIRSMAAEHPEIDLANPDSFVEGVPYDRFDHLRTELSADIARVDGHVGEVRTEVAQVRSDLTYVALAVGARGAEGSG